MANQCQSASAFGCNNDIVRKHISIITIKLDGLLPPSGIQRTVMVGLLVLIHPLIYKDADAETRKGCCGVGKTL